MLTLAKHIENLPQSCLRGLMAKPAPTDKIAEQEAVFRKMSDPFEQLKQVFTQSTNSIHFLWGMTDDMPSAIKCGSTMVRIGTAIFGEKLFNITK